MINSIYVSVIKNLLSAFHKCDLPRKGHRMMSLITKSEQQQQQRKSGSTTADTDPDAQFGKLLKCLKLRSIHTTYDMIFSSQNQVPAWT